MTRATVDQLQYELPRQLIQEELDFREVERMTDIWIYPNYPRGFTAVVGVYIDKVYVFEVEKASITSIDLKPCLGVRPNGSLIY